MDTLLLSRLQFSLTLMVHYLFPPLSIGLGTFLVVAAGLWWRTGSPVWEQASRFWTGVFGLTFAIGVATGIPMEFQFGTNWATYSRFVGDVFGSALAAEGIFAFFLESGFLALVLFGRERIPRWLYALSTFMVALGAHFSAVWIVVAGSWMHTPAGFHVVAGPLGPRAEITDFWAMVLNPSSPTRLAHVIGGSWLAGSFLVLSMSAWYLLKGRHRAFAIASIKVALPLAAITAILQAAVTGDRSAKLVAEHQPAKFAALEGHWPESAPGDQLLFGWVDAAHERTVGPRLPGLTSWLLYGSREAPVRGLRSFRPEDRPPVQLTFQSYHLMVAIGVGLILLALLGLGLWWRGTLWTARPVLWLFVVAVAGPVIANEAGWVAAEVGRQPWIVNGLLRTGDAVSPSIDRTQLLGSLAMFGLIYAGLLAVFFYLLNGKIRHGPEPLADQPPDRPLAETLHRHRAEAR